MIARRIYVASSWRNSGQPAIVEALRAAGHDVYDFRNPAPGQKGFAWRDCGGEAATDGPGTGARTIPAYLEAIRSQRAIEGFGFDKRALDWCDTCVLVLPCGRSAHLELGYAAGQGKDTYVLLHEDKFEPELMYLLNTDICTDVQEIIDLMGDRQPGDIVRWHAENRGHGKRAAGHALRLLRESVELCVATSASVDEIAENVGEEIDKASMRQSFNAPYDPAAVELEWADCALLVDIFASLYSIDPVATKRAKIDVLWQRRWRADADGVLWRDERPAGNPAAAGAFPTMRQPAMMPGGEVLTAGDSDGGDPD